MVHSSTSSPFSVKKLSLFIVKLKIKIPTHFIGLLHRYVAVEKIGNYKLKEKHV